jgi:hypothetical protein
MSEATATASVPGNPPAPPPVPASSVGAPSQQSASPAAPPPARVISDSDYDGLPVADQDRYARVKKGADGGSEWRARSSLPSEANPTATPATGDTAAAPPAVTEDGKLRIGSMELSESDITGLMERHALEQTRKATMPTSAADYKLDLPADLPEGQTFQWATDHPVQGPLIGQAKELAHSLGMDQAGFSKMMNLYAASQIHEAQMIAKAQTAEREKLGPNITLRVDAVTNFIRAAVSDDKIAKGLTQRILTADDLIGWEKVIRKATSQGAASFRQDGREPNAGGRGPLSSLSEAEYGALSASERYAIAKRG